MKPPHSSHLSASNKCVRPCSCSLEEMSACRINLRVWSHCLWTDMTPPFKPTTRRAPLSWSGMLSEVSLRLAEWWLWAYLGFVWRIPQPTFILWNTRSSWSLANVVHRRQYPFHTGSVRPRSCITGLTFPFEFATVPSPELTGYWLID